MNTNKWIEEFKEKFYSISNPFGEIDGFTEALQDLISKVREEERERIIEDIKQFDGYDCGKLGCKDQVKSIIKSLSTNKTKGE